MVDENKPDFVEAAIYMASVGEQAGQYIATCAKDECGYSGEFSCARMFQHVHISLSALGELVRQARPHQELCPPKSAVT